MALRHQLARMEVGRPGRGESPDWVAVEEPLEVRIAGEVVATLMRTPGDDHLLTLGFLYGERVLEGAEDVASVVHCGNPEEEGWGNVVDVRPAGGARIAWERVSGAERQGAVSSACGVCGRRTVDELLDGLPPLPGGPVWEVSAIRAAMERLREHQPAFDATGGTHAAAAWSAEGELLAVHEDVGRHNTVDKVVGALLLRRAESSALPRAELLTVSGRAGLEIVQKAVRAGIPIVASVSAPTSLAVQFARAAGLTLLGFVRGEKMNVYSGSDRVCGAGLAAVPAA